MDLRTGRALHKWRVANCVLHFLNGGIDSLECKCLDGCSSSLTLAKLVRNLWCLLVSITLQLTLRNGDDDAPVLSPVLKRATSLRKDMLHRFLLEQPTENFVPAICSRNKLSGFQVAAGAQEEIAIPSRFFLSSPLHPGTKQNKSPLGLCCCHSLLYYLLVMGHLNGGCARNQH